MRLEEAGDVIIKRRLREESVSFLRGEEESEVPFRT